MQLVGVNPLAAFERDMVVDLLTARVGRDGGRGVLHLQLARLECLLRGLGVLGLDRLEGEAAGFAARVFQGVEESHRQIDVAALRIESAAIADRRFDLVWAKSNVAILGFGAVPHALGRILVDHAVIAGLLEGANDLGMTGGLLLFQQRIQNRGMFAHDRLTLFKDRRG